MPISDCQRPAWLRLAVVGALLLAWLLGAVGQAQEVAPVETDLLLVRRAGDERVVGRLRIELEQSAWQTIEIGPSEERADAELGALGRARGARAALRVDASGNGIELWVASGEGDEQDSVEVLTAPGGDERVLALRAVEALRARGMLGASIPARSDEAVADKPEPARPDKPAPAAADAASADEEAGEEESAEGTADADGDDDAESEAEAESEPEITEPELPPPPPPLLALELLPGLGISAGGLGPALGGAVGVRLALADAWALEVLAFAPLWSERLQGMAGEGSARVSPFLFAGGVQWAIIRAPIELALNADAGALLLYTRGEANAPLASSSDSVFAAAGLFGTSLRIPLSSTVRLSARAQIGLTSPRITVQLGTRDAAQFGAPFALFCLGLDFALL